MREGLPLEMLHDEKVDWVAVRGRIARRSFTPDVVQDTDVRVLERGDCLCFATESSERRRVGNECRRKNLDRDCSVQTGVAGAIHLSHPTSAKQRFDLVGAEPNTSGEGHGWRDYRSRPQ